MNWNGVMPAITTCFDAELAVDHGFMAKHCNWLLDNGCTGIVALGSLGEGATLSYGERKEVLRTCVKSVRGRAPVVASISALSTAEATSLAKDASDIGCDACFDELDRFVELELAGEDADAAIPGLRAHLAGCPACREEHESLLALAADERR